MAVLLLYLQIHEQDEFNEKVWLETLLGVSGVLLLLLLLLCL